MEKVNWIPNKAEYWHNLPAPARPWPSEVKWFEKYAVEMKERGRRDVLILGSTVEFRSMLHRFGMNVHIVDFSREFYHILTETQKDRLEYTGPETFYEQNWLTMDLGKQFDLIFGDWIPGVLQLNEYDTFYKNIAKHLKNDSLFIDRNCVKPDRKEIDMDEIVKKHYAMHGDMYSFYETSMQYMYCYRLDPVTANGLLQESHKVMDSVFEKGLLTKKDYDVCKAALAVESGSLTCTVKEDFEKQLQRYFIIVAEHHVVEPSSVWYPIYVLRKK